MKKQDLETSAPSLRQTLRGRDYFTLAFGSMVGVEWTLANPYSFSSRHSLEVSNETPDK
jgi:hypothetical protein